MIRKILAVLAGYAIFVISSLLLFNLSGQKPHAEAPIVFKLLTLIYGGAFSALSGYVLRLIAKTRNLNLNYILAIIIAGFATFSLFSANGSHWTQLLAIFIFAPASIAGGKLYSNKHI
ncbi:hypothetical protein [Pedobacter soli]|uniref:Uncharacterized protein n=1 Tax=Pedobacter soli TaxID=390242 RepID=A0A1G7CTZ4_9SPHI|nr:hypothetical protein [Pedobacter soli]SDE42778.1 hypothetical protein SAMN04488024_12111 [Pedobacter soli]